nr:uncharacterized protein LOC118878575 [Drosophila suzukii]XP_036677497.1 uncharacterized protein LOC118878575 [Drosophila suzukii]
MQVLNPTMSQTENLNEIIKNLNDFIKSEMSEFQERESGWSLIEIVHLEVNINIYQPIKGSNFIGLPREIVNRKACINVQNRDEHCFKWALISAFVKLPCNKNLPNQYKRKGIYNIGSDIININNKSLHFSGLKFPTPVDSIKIFEENNPEISVTVLGVDSDEKTIIGPYYLTNNKTSNVLHTIYLLLLEKDDKYHYAWTKNISKLLRKQITKSTRKILLCNGCFLHFYDSDKLERHIMECNRIVTEMPSNENAILRFKNFKNQLDVPFVEYADFQCILEGMDLKTSDNVKLIQKHIPYAYSYYIKCSFDNSFDIYRIYYGEDCVAHFVDSIYNDCLMLYQNHLNVTIPLYPLSMEQQKIMDLEQNCSICGNLFTDQSKRVLDHCHLTGKYRGVAHNNCNLNYKLAKFFPIFFHNLSAYDAHLFVKELIKIPGEISLIPLNKEFYLSISKKIYIKPNEMLELRFLDSFRFMSSSLDSLASYLKEENLTTIKSFFTDPNKFQMVKRKGIFPYSYLNSVERLSDTQLPSRENFYNQLTDRHCSEESYQHAQNIWNAFVIFKGRCAVAMRCL